MTPPEWLPADERALAQLRERDVCDLYEKEYQRRDGTRVPILICNAMMPGDSGEILAFVLDITQRKQAEEELATSHRLMQDLIDNTTSMVFACDLEERFVLANAPLAALLKTTPAQLVGKRRHEVMPQADADAHEANDQETIAAGRAMEFEEHSDLHGRSITWLTTKFPLRDAQGRIYGVAGIVTDITERKRAIEALNKTNAQLRAIFDTVPIALAITDSQGGNIQTNQAFDKLWGEPRPTAASVNDYVAYKAWWIESGEPVLPEKWASARAVQKGETITGQMMRIERFDGSSAFIHNSAAPILDETGKITGSIVAIMDISKLVQAEEALRRAYADMEAKVVERTRELREKDQMLIMQSRQAAMGEMISNIAHQWRQPLNSLGLVIQQLPLFYEKGQLDGYLLTKNVRNSMEIIKHMSATIEDFRNFFKPDREKADFRLKDVIDHLLSLIKESFENNRIRIKVVENADPVVHGFQNELAQSLLNILNNARDTFIERGCDNPAVTITIASQDGKNVITIADNAGGIPEEIITKVFDPYFTTKGPQHGTGVGLYMSKAIIEKNMGGRLSARNTGDGAEFRIEL
jgi:PAS domain S-box-containing protein